MSVLDFVVTVLATWRLAHLLVQEDGPFAMFARLRHATGVRSVVRRLPADGSQMAVSRTARNTLAEGLTCIWCTSVWTAAALVVIERWPLGRICMRILAISAGAIVAQEGIERLKQ